jgi:hypothetical protein
MSPLALAARFRAWRNALPWANDKSPLVIHLEADSASNADISVGDVLAAADAIERLMPEHDEPRCITCGHLASEHVYREPIADEPPRTCTGCEATQHPAGPFHPFCSEAQEAVGLAIGELERERDHWKAQFESISLANASLQRHAQAIDTASRRIVADVRELMLKALLNTFDDVE